MKRILCNSFNNLKSYGITLYFSTLLSEDLDYVDKEDYFYSADIPFGARIAIYGFGPYGKCAFLDFFSKNEIVGIYDKNFEKYGKKVISPDKIKSDDFDFIILSVMNDNAVISICNFFKDINIPKEKIVKVNYSYSYYSQGYWFFLNYWE